MHELTFLQTHIATDKDSSSLLIYGNTRDYPVILKATGFKPYFYIKTTIPISQIETMLLKISPEIKLISIIGTDIYGYHNPEEFIKVLCPTIRIFNNARYAFENLNSAQVRLYESNVSYVMRFMIDMKITGMQYLRVTKYEDINESFDQEVEKFINEYDLDSFSDDNLEFESDEFKDQYLKNRKYQELKINKLEELKNRKFKANELKDNEDREMNSMNGFKDKDNNNNDYYNINNNNINDNEIIHHVNSTHNNNIHPSNKILKIKTHYSNINPLPFDEEFSLLPKMKILSFDIETLTEKNIFPDSKKNPIIQIGNTISYGSEKKQIIFCYKECAPIPGVNVLNFETEIEMIRSWGDFVLKEDPDIIIGYNIKDFDIPYILARAKNIKNFHLGRNFDNHSPDLVKSALSSSKQSGIYGQNNINIEGRLIFDMIQIIRRDFKLHSYSLNSVSVHFLGEQKEDLPYYFIEKLWKKNPEARARIATYCLKDTYLPLRLFEKLKILFNYTEIARVTGIPIEFQMTRGTSIKVFSLILRKAKETNYLVPTINSKGSDESYEGAFVMDPQRGFYNMPVAVLDFASLYPSIIIAFNLCYSTFVNREMVNEINFKGSVNDFNENFENQNEDHECENNIKGDNDLKGEGNNEDNDLKRSNDVSKHNINVKGNINYNSSISIGEIKKEDIYVSPTNSHFVKPKIRKGILPEILEFLIAERRKVKKMMKGATGDNLNILNGRQLALKIAANGLYGFTGSTIGLLPLLDIPTSVTSIGRGMIAESKRIVESQTYETILGICDERVNERDDKNNNNDKTNFYIYNKVKDDNSNISNKKNKIRVLYGDTDSVMVYFGEKDMNKVFKMARNLAEIVSSHFFKPVSLEFEKVYFPFLLMNKKRYAGLIYTEPDKMGRIDTKGIETVRRDNCGLVRNVINKCLQKILIDRDVESAQEYVKNVVRDLYLDRIDLSQLVISKAISKNSEDYAAKQAHVALAEKMAKRENQSSINLGERIAYVITKGDKKARAYEKSEDPIYVLENNIPIDTNYYIENQLSKPIFRLFDPIMDNVSELFVGEHSRVISKSQVKGPMAGFIQKSVVCLKCKKNGKILCRECYFDGEEFKYSKENKLEDSKDKENIVNSKFKNNKNANKTSSATFSYFYVKIMNEIEEKKICFAKCWTECQRCMESVHNEVACVNRDCPIYYMRIKARKDVDGLMDKMKLLKELEW